MTYNTDMTLHDWAQQQLDQHPDIVCSSPLQLTPLSGDAGFRQYFRVNTQPALLAVAAPETDGVSECADHFAQLSTLLRQQGVPTPQVIGCDKHRNFLLIEDFGNETLLEVLTSDNVDWLYGEALMVLLRMQQLPRNDVTMALPDYNRKALREEMVLFNEWFVETMLGHSLSATEQQLLDTTFDFLEQQALAQPQVLVHRDYHSRNILHREGEAPGVIDFQDAVWGPITYDVVSLLKDCYIAWPEEQVQRWLIAYGNMAIELGILPVISEQRLIMWFDTMGLQRHIKVLGIFARLYLRDGKPGYLDDLPLVWHYTLQAANRYPQMQPFSEWCEQTLLPLVRQQAWYRDANPLNSELA